MPAHTAASHPVPMSIEVTCNDIYREAVFAKPYRTGRFRAYRTGSVAERHGSANLNGIQDFQIKIIIKKEPVRTVPNRTEPVGSAGLGTVRSSLSRFGSVFFSCWVL